MKIHPQLPSLHLNVVVKGVYSVHNYLLYLDTVDTVVLSPILLYPPTWNKKVSTVKKIIKHAESNQSGGSDIFDFYICLLKYGYHLHAEQHRTKLWSCGLRVPHHQL